MSARWFTAGAFALCLVAAGLLSAHASGHPDGLEYVARTHGFLDSGSGIGSIGVPRISGRAAGMIGCALTFTLVFAVMTLPRLRDEGRNGHHGKPWSRQGRSA